MENPDNVDDNLEENSDESGQGRVQLIQVAEARPQDQYDFIDLSARDSPQEQDVQVPTATTTTSPNAVESEEYTSSSEQSQLEESDEFGFSEDQATFGYPKPPEELRPLSASIHSSRASSSEPGKYTGTEEKLTQHLQVPHYKTQPDEFKERQLQKSGFGNQQDKEKRRSGTGRKRHRRKSETVQTRKRISTGEQSQLQVQRNPPRPLTATVRPKSILTTFIIEPGKCITTGSTGSKESHQPTTIPPQIMVSDGFREVTLSESKEATPLQSRFDSKEATPLQSRFDSRESNQNSREANLNSREAKLDSREANLDSREANLDSREANLTPEKLISIPEKQISTPDKQIWRSEKQIWRSEKQIWRSEKQI